MPHLLSSPLCTTTCPWEDFHKPTDRAVEVAALLVEKDVSLEKKTLSCQSNPGKSNPEEHRITREHAYSHMPLLMESECVLRGWQHLTIYVTASPQFYNFPNFTRNCRSWRNNFSKYHQVS